MTSTHSIPGRAFHALYTALTIVLLVCVSLLLHLAVCTLVQMDLPSWAYGTIPLLGIAIGIPTANRWWQWVYVERRRWRGNCA